MPLLLKVDAILKKKNEPPTNNILTFTEIKRRSDYYKGISA